MNPLSEFQFLQPWALLVAVPLIGVGLWTLQQRQGQQVWHRLFDAQLLRRFLVAGNASGNRKAPVLLVLVSLLLAIALAQPVWRTLPQPVFAAESALVIALDLSASMDATDVAPSRLKQARFKLRDLLATRREGQTALLVYAGDAFVVTPLTDDSATIQSQLNALETAIMPVQGSRPVRALAQAEALLRQAGIGQGDILLVGDALAGDAVLEQAQALQRKGYRLSVLTLGTAAGAPVPGLKRSDGTPVIARTDLAQMARVASAGGGLSLVATADNSDIARLQALYSSYARNAQVRQTEREHDQWVAEGPWFILLALPLLLPLFRRGVLSVVGTAVLAGLLLTPAQPTLAADWQQRWADLWQRPDQQAMEKWRQGDKAAAAAQFEQPDWQQAARYQQQDFTAASQALTPETFEQWYNQGNALARQGRFDDALAAYDQALALQPEHADAKANKALVTAAKQQLEQTQPPQPSSESGPSEPSDNSESQSPQNADDASPSDGQGEPGEGEPASSEPSTDTDNEAAAEQAEAASEPDAAPTTDDAEAAEPQRQQAQQQFSDALDQADAAEPAPALAHSLDDAEPLDEQQQARQQLLNRVIDDPAGLWRRKFLYQYQQQAEPLPPGEQPW